MSTTAMPVYAWNTLPWKTIERNVFKLQKRIYQASQRGDVKTVHRLQRFLMKSWSAKHLAVRRVTQDNQGKKTAGVDGVKSLTPPQRTRLAEVLELQPKAKPVRRVWIPKPGTQEKRGLGIPAMDDRASQALAKLALEPEWEVRFEENSYGFRPGRSCHDAIEAIFNSIRYKATSIVTETSYIPQDATKHQGVAGSRSHGRVGTFRDNEGDAARRTTKPIAGECSPPRTGKGHHNGLSPTKTKRSVDTHGHPLCG